jgi:hypothetical protein
VGKQRTGDDLDCSSERSANIHVGNDAWIVHGYYVKRQAKLDKIGRAAVERAIKAKDDYEERVKRGVYYERT